MQGSGADSEGNDNEGPLVFYRVCKKIFHSAYAQDAPPKRATKPQVGGQGAEEKTDWAFANSW